MKPLLLMIVLAALAGCSTPAPPADLTGAWRIEDVNGGGVIDSARLEITFAADGGVTGYGGCNSFTGRYAQDGASVEIGPLASTRRACAAEALTLQEARVLQALDAVTRASLEADGALILSGPAPARLLLRRMDDEAMAEEISVRGEVVAPPGADLPAGAIVRVVAQDVARQDVAAPELARVEAPATNGPIFTFSIAIPRERLTPHSQLAIRAQILLGYGILYTSTQRYDIAVDRPNAPLRIVVTAVDGGTGAGGRPVTPTPQSYHCGGERMQVAFEEGAAFLTFADGATVRLDRLRPEGAEDPEAPRLFTNGRVTLRQETEGTAGPIVSFARGRAAFVTCRRV